jgi:hypothetical protein
MTRCVKISPKVITVIYVEHKVGYRHQPHLANAFGILAKILNILNLYLLLYVTLYKVKLMRHVFHDNSSIYYYHELCVNIDVLKIVLKS